MIETKTRISPRPLQPSEIEALRSSLLRERAALTAQYQDDIRSVREIHEEGVEDLAELAAIDVDRELLFTLCELDVDKLEQIDDALRSMDEGTYGLCQYGGEPIPLARLREVPWARYCAPHQELSEEETARRSSVPELNLVGQEP